MNTTENNTTPKTTADKLSELYTVTRKPVFGPTGGLERTDYAFEFKFTSKEDYLNFRTLWKSHYAAITEQTRAYRAAHTAYRNAGGFGRLKNVSGDLDAAERAYRNVSEPYDREYRRMLCELRVASKKHAQACYLAAQAEKQAAPQK
jgi:hypothetical protein